MVIISIFSCFTYLSFCRGKTPGSLLTEDHFTLFCRRLFSLVQWFDEKGGRISSDAWIPYHAVHWLLFLSISSLLWSSKHTLQSDSGLNLALKHTSYVILNSYLSLIFFISEVETPTVPKIWEVKLTWQARQSPPLLSFPFSATHGTFNWPTSRTLTSPATLFLQSPGRLLFQWACFEGINTIFSHRFSDQREVMPPLGKPWTLWGVVSPPSV